MPAKTDPEFRTADLDRRSLEPGAVSYKAPIYDGGAPPKGQQRRLVTDGVNAALEDIATFQQLGVHELAFDFRAAFLNECLDRMQQFGEEIIKRA